MQTGRIVEILIVAVASLIAAVWLWQVPPHLDASDDPTLRSRRGGIQAVYYAGEFEKEVLRRVDRRMHFRTDGKVAPEVPADDFSARWEGYVYFKGVGPEWLCTENDDKARLWLAGELMIDAWYKYAPRENCVEVDLYTGWYPLKVEYHDITRRAQLTLRKGRRMEESPIVKSRSLCCTRDG
jgi:hypothetical protein